MKNLFKNYLSWLAIGLWFLSILIIWFYITKARSWTTSIPWDKLTSAKWNEMINKISTVETNNITLQNQINSMKRIDVNTSDTSLFNTGCDRKWYAWSSFYQLADEVYSDWTRIFRARPAWSDSSLNHRFSVLYTDKSHLRYRSDDTIITTRTISKIQKRCQN